MIIMIFSDLTIRISAENGPRVYYLTLYTWTVLYAKSLKNTRLGGKTHASGNGTVTDRSLRRIFFEISNPVCQDFVIHIPGVGTRKIIH